ncbi:unnamed protein product [Sphagnum troendelagicum]
MGIQMGKDAEGFLPTNMYTYAALIDQLERNCWPIVVTLTTSTGALAKGGCHQEAMEVWKEMQSMGCDPNIFTNTVLSHIHTGAGKLDAASEIFEKLEEVNCQPNHIMYSLLIDTHTKAGRVEQALSFYK